MAARPRAPMKIGLPAVRQSAKPLGKSTVDESRTLVAAGGHASKAATDPISIASDPDTSSSSGDDDDDEPVAADPDAADDVPMAEAAPSQPHAAAHPHNEPDQEEEGDDEAAEPSFGDRIHALSHDPMPIDVAAAFHDPAQTLTYPGAQRQPPTGASLGTTLAQALKTNDVALLEVCLSTTDLNTIRATIQRLDSALAGLLLQKIADRMFRRPGRAGSLMVWVQWTAVTHGGYLATQRHLVPKLAELDRVVDGRSAALRPVLALKGKLDMMGAQVEYRRSVQEQRRRVDEHSEDEDVIYVEAEDAVEAEGVATRPNGRVEDLDRDVEEDDMPITDGLNADEEDESSDEEGGLIDDQADETDADTGDDEDLDVDDDSRGEEDDDSEADVASPPAKRSKTHAAFPRRR